MVRSSHLFQNFPQFVVIHTVKGFSVVNEEKADIFLEFFCFFYDPVTVSNLISGSSAFPNLVCTSESYCTAEAYLEVFEHNLSST